jgi:hypothetical protein
MKYKLLASWRVAEEGVSRRRKRGRKGKERKRGEGLTVEGDDAVAVEEEQ